MSKHSLPFGILIALIGLLGPYEGLAQIRDIRIPPMPPMPPHSFPPPMPPMPPSPPMPPPLTPSPPPFAAPLTSRPAGGGSPPGGGGSYPSREFVVAACAFTFDNSTDCYDRSVVDAAGALSEFYLDAARKRVVHNMFKLRFPMVVERTKQIRFLGKLEQAAVKTVSAQLKNDLKKLAPMQWDSEEEKQRKLAEAERVGAEVTSWEQSARSEAASGQNWSHNWSDDSHTYQLGYAFSQAKHISVSVSSWGGT